MSRRPALFTEADLRRARAAVRKEGNDAVVEVTPDGVIRIVPLSLTKPTEAAPPKRRIVL